ncbi:MAG: ABC transporter permease [Actinomycetota bacterium]|nr:ABC transporter permease [Actinomycetota bacterium]
MRRVTLRSLWEHKRRLVSTVVSIVLGVSFMTGTFILSTTLDQAYDDLFASALEDVDAVVRGPLLFTDQFGVNHYEQVDRELVDQVADVPGVAAAAPRAAVLGAGATNRVLTDDGSILGGSSGPPTNIENWIEVDELNPYDLEDGRAPRADDEVVLNVGAAKAGEFEVGDTVTIVGAPGPKDYELVGVSRFGTAESAAGAVTASITLPEAQRLAAFAERDVVQRIYVAADDRTPDQLVADLTEALAGVEVVTGEQAVQELSANRTSGFGFLKTALNVFGAVALFVGAFVISNTFSILVAQRTRELALLRTLGASREQVLGSVLLEAAVVGSVGSVLGLGGGVLLAKGIGSALGAVGGSLPTSSLVVRPVTFVLSIATGVTITVVAAIIPAFRATRVRPLAALRDVAIDRSNVSRFRIGAGGVMVVVGAWFLGEAWRSDGHSRALPTVGIGCFLMLAGALVVGPVLAGRTVRLFGRPLPRFKGVTGRIATENAARSPKRTSATASAVVIGVALVTFVTVFARSADASVDYEVRRVFAGDFLVKAEGSGLIPIGMPLEVAETVAEVPGVQQVIAGGLAPAELVYPNGEKASHFVTGFDERGFGSIIEPNLVKGEVEDFDDAGILIDRQVADDHDIELGDRIVVRNTDGTIEQVVQGIIDDRNVLGFAAITRTTFQEANPGALDTNVGAIIDPGADLAAVMEDVEAAVARFPDLEVLDQEGVVGDFKTQITGFITIMYGLLMLSIVIALIGVANTLSLSISERVRELGLLRAVGMDATDLRSAIRWEAWLICLLGTLVGVSVGLVVGVALTKALKAIGLTTFAVPFLGIVVIIALSAVLGTLASVRPARRAARLPILAAIATE